MENVRRTDLILHSYNKKIATISVAKSNCEDSHQPLELQDEKLWENHEYIVYTGYIILEKSIITSNHRYFESLAAYQAPIFSPFV